MNFFLKITICAQKLLQQEQNRPDELHSIEFFLHKYIQLPFIFIRQILRKIKETKK
jgi:hypothetical protein